MVREPSCSRFPASACCIVFILARPQEFLPLLQKVPFLHLGAALAAIGYVVDVRLHRLQPIATNTLPWVDRVLLVGADLDGDQRARAVAATRRSRWRSCSSSTGRSRTASSDSERFQFVAGVLAVDVRRSSRSSASTRACRGKQCVGGQAVVGDVDGKPDGRLCETHLQCSWAPRPSPASRIAASTSACSTRTRSTDRVRYIGELHDPNEVALTLARRRHRAPDRVCDPQARSAGRSCSMVARRRAHARDGLADAVTRRSRRGDARARRLRLTDATAGVRSCPPRCSRYPCCCSAVAAARTPRSSTMLRYEAWAAGLEMFKQQPVLSASARACSPTTTTSPRTTRTC